MLLLNLEAREQPSAWWDVTGMRTCTEQYPGEKEITFPPYTCLESHGDARLERDSHGGEVIIFPLKVSPPLPFDGHAPHCMFLSRGCRAAAVAAAQLLRLLPCWCGWCLAAALLLPCCCCC